MGAKETKQVVQAPILAIELLRRAVATPEVFRGWLRQLGSLTAQTAIHPSGEMEILGTYHSTSNHDVVRLELELVYRSARGKIRGTTHGTFLLLFNKEGRVIATDLKTIA